MFFRLLLVFFFIVIFLLFCGFCFVFVRERDSLVGVCTFYFFAVIKVRLR